ncbi:MAG: DUF2232 domain-containing protein [Spirochaetaceae bacterium]|nr:MAG: DUF2232 domain-containing protein [Spirochaetaceae bacterium]
MIEILIFAAVSTLLYRLGLGPLLFLIPLQVLYMRRGRKYFAAAAGLSLVLILLIGVLLARRWSMAGAELTQAALSRAAPFLLLDMAVAVLLIGGLALIQLPEMNPELQVYRLPRVTRLAIATIIAGILSVPLILYLRGNDEFAAGVREFVGLRIEAMNNAFMGADSDSLLPGVQPLQTEALLEAINAILLRSFLFYYFLLLTFSWWLGTIIGARSVGKHPGLTRIADFKLPDRYIWPLIASLALVVLTLVASIEFLGILAWNALLILVFLYGVSGLGIIRFLLKKLNVRPGVRWMLIAAIIILAMTPRIGIAVLILVPGLGVSEVWLKYRREERSNI